LNDPNERDPRLFAIPDTHGHAKGEHKPYAEERPLPLTARMLFLWFYHACRRGYPRFLMVADHMNYLTFEDPAAVNLVRRALKLAQAGDLYGAAETATVDVGHAAVVSEGLRRGMRYSIGAEVDNDPRSRPDAQNIVDAMRPDAIIRSVHFIPITHPVLGENWPWPFDNPEFKDLFEVVGTEHTWETYVTALVDAIERLPGHIVGHFFVPAVFGHWPDDAKLDQYENRVLDAAGTRGMAVEFNTRFLYRDHTDEEKQRYIDANKRFLRKARDRGVMIAIGSDAHSPKDQGGAFSTVLDVLDELEINEIVFPLAGTLRRVALRVVREPEPEPPAPAPEPVPEPQRAHERGAASDGAAEPAKPVRKARPSAKATRPPETSPERPRERPETSATATETPPPEPPPTASAQPDGAGADDSAASPPTAAAAPPDGAPPRPARPPRNRKSRAKPKPAAADAHAAPAPVAEAAPRAEAEPARQPKPAEPEKPPAAKVVAKAPATSKAAASKPVPSKPAAKPVAKKPVAAKSPPAKARPTARTAKPAAASSKSAPARATSSKASPVKPGAKKSAPAKAAAKKAAPARSPAKKTAPAKKGVAAKKAPAKKAKPARATAKKSAPKKATAKKAPPARKAPARKAAAKKTAKKTAKRR
jgi:HisJ family histidinol phosphate phosphatase